MKSYSKELDYVVPEPQGVVNITADVRACLKASGIQEGLCLVNSMNVTSGIFVNDDDADLHAKIFEWLNELAPHDPECMINPKNPEACFLDTHLKRILMGRDTVIAVSKGDLVLGTWEQILYFEFDGKRRKHVLVKIIGE
jgi:secondary thiamine-phosphate synthase enzyme